MHRCNFTGIEGFFDKYLCHVTGKNLLHDFLKFLSKIVFILVLTMFCNPMVLCSTLLQKVSVALWFRQL